MQRKQCYSVLDHMWSSHLKVDPLPICIEPRKRPAPREEIETEEEMQNRKRVRSEYMKNWRKNHPGRTTLYNKRYWEKRVRNQLANEIKQP